MPCVCVYLHGVRGYPVTYMTKRLDFVARTAYVDTEVRFQGTGRSSANPERVSKQEQLSFLQPQL